MVLATTWLISTLEENHTCEIMLPEEMGTRPRPLVEQITAALAGLLRDPVILGRLAKQGIEPQALSPEAFGALLREDFAKMARVVKASGAKID